MEISKDMLVGYTLDWIKKVPREPDSLSDAKNIISSLLPAAWKVLNDSHTKIVTQLKAAEPAEWLHVEAEFPVGSVGATRFKKGYMIIVDKGEVEFGALKPAFREYFFHGSHMPPELTVRQLPNIWRKQSLESGEAEKTGQGYTVWMTFASKPEAYAISPRAVKEKWYPPEGISALPKKIREQIPEEFHYWKKKGNTAHELRDSLVQQIKEKNVILKYSEADEFARGRPRKKYKKLKKPKIDSAPVPSPSVAAKIASVLFYHPPKELKYKWVTSKGENCPDCSWLEKNSPFSLEELPTYPKEGKTFCRHQCECTLKVVFPDGVEYSIIPVKEKSLYNSDWVKRTTPRLLKDFTPSEVKSASQELYEAFEKKFDIIKSLIIDYKNMDRIDKAFMVFAGQPIIKDAYLAWDQAQREVYASLSLEDKERLNTDSEFYDKINYGQKVDAVAIRLLTERQILEVEKQLGFCKNMILEVITSQLLAGVTQRFFSVLTEGIKKIKNFKDTPYIGRLVQKAITEAQKHRSVALTKRIKEEHAAAKKFIDHVKLWPRDIGAIIVAMIERMISFWKDCVLIFHPGTAIRNMCDNTLKAINEMLNALFEGRPFWAFFVGKGKNAIKIPKEVADQSWVRSVSDYKYVKELEGRGINWWQKLRNMLYENLLSKPEAWARRGLYVGKMKRFEKDLLNMGRNPKDFEKLMRTKAIEEVNRVFFDYSKRMEIEVGLSKIFPFEAYNIRNFNYWLNDFVKYPWKLGVIRGVWQWWSEQTHSNCEFKIKDKIPLYLIPGVYFNPLSWLSAYKFIKVFAMYKGEPKWLTAKEKHLKYLSEMLKKLPPEERSRVLTKAKLKSVQDFEDRQKCKWVKVTVNFLDEWLGLLPMWKKVLAELHLAEKEEYKKMFPQGPLVDALSSAMFNEFRGSVKPPSTKTLSEIYAKMEEAGIPKDRKIAEKIYRSWEIQKRVVAYFTGMYLTRSWRGIQLTHEALLEELESRESREFKIGEAL